MEDVGGNISNHRTVTALICRRCPLKMCQLHPVKEDKVIQLCVIIKHPKSNMATTKNSKSIRATAKKLYQAFTEPKALEVWLVPGKMTAKVHNFDLRVGGGYQMSLFYPPTDKTSQGKTTNKEDRYTSRFLELIPNKRIVQAITFDTENPDFSDEMIMEVTFEEDRSETTVTIVFKNIPSGIRPEDNEEGTKSSLEKLTQYVE